MSTAAISKAQSFIQDHLDESLAELSRLIASPSISSQNVSMGETAELVATMLENHGLEAKLMPGSQYPIVYGEASGESDQTMLCYNHYDVQPAEPLEGWDSAPFELSQRDGKVYGRGVSDDKGHIISRLAALDAVREQRGRFPCNIKFVIEGGEEISSPDVPEFVEAHRNLLRADACVWETGGVEFDGRPMMVLGMRGICYLQYDLRTMGRDAHSGSAHLLPNAAWRLVRALSTIKDEKERVLIAGFLDDAIGPTESDLALLEELDANEEEMKKSYGISDFNLGLTGFEAKKAVFSPTANIAGLSAGYEGKGPKTVIPSTASAKMDFRLIPDQDPKDVMGKVRKHLDAHGFQDIEITYLGGERAAQTAPDDAFVRLGIETAEEVYGREAAVSPLIGGSGPMYAFRKHLGVPIISVGIGYPEALIHAPNENIRLNDFILGTSHMALVLDRFAAA